VHWCGERAPRLWHTGPQTDSARSNTISPTRTATRGLTGPYARTVERQIEDILAQVAPRRVGDTPIRRAVSVLAVGIEGFAGLCEELEPPEVASVLDLYLNVVDDSVGTYLGTIHGHLGSLVLASWNAVTMHPEHATLAVNAALAIARRMDDVNQRLRLQELPEIASASGINTGDAVVRRLDRIGRGEEPIGDAVNIARLLSECAGAGKILIGEGTRVSLDDGIRVEPSEITVLPGKQHPLRIFQVIPDVD
jgi:adenylate cyclase